MQQNWLNRLLLSIAILAITLSTWAIIPVAHAFNNPDLLPQIQTPVIDLAGIFTDIQENLLAKDI
ncbi:MAG: TPM domain-containing protein, partial [Planktothrix agardhii]